jgi:CRP-like cAMP-binding protein
MIESKSINNLIAFISKYIRVEIALRSRILEITHIKQYPSNTIIISEGQYCRHFRYLDSGCVRYHANYDGKEITTWIEIENQLLYSYDGFSFRKAGGETLETVEDSVLVEISAEAILKLFKDFPIMERFTRLWYEDELSNQLEFYKFFMFMSAKDKYERLLSYVPSIELRLKAIHIASLLGISPETLSRLRADSLK